MSVTTYPDRVVRIAVTEDQWKRLRIIAVERGCDIRTLMTDALRTSPLTKGVFEQ